VFQSHRKLELERMLEEMSLIAWKWCVRSFQSTIIVRLLVEIGLFGARLHLTTVMCQQISVLLKSSWRREYGISFILCGVGELPPAHAAHAAHAANAAHAAHAAHLRSLPGGWDLKLSFGCSDFLPHSVGHRWSVTVRWRRWEVAVVTAENQARERGALAP
jgi:hypothetical protein